MRHPSYIFATLVCSVFAFASNALSQPLGTQPETLREPLASADRCTECHASAKTPTGELYMAGDTWSASMMANSARDPLFLATLTIAEQDSPGLGTTCLRCHTPSAFVAGRATPGFGTRLSALDGDTDGVHCDTCHRSIIPDGVAGAPHVGNAQLYFSDGTADTLPLRFGPRNDPYMSPRHPSMGSTFLRDARLCGQCHDVNHPNNPRLSTEGRMMAPSFPLQSTYTEWSQSDFARRGQPETCQTCHMREIAGDPLPSTRIPGAPSRPNQRRHEFMGANEWGMAMLRAAYPGDRDESYDAMRTQIRAYLRTAARVELLTPPTTAAAGSTVMLRVRVTNLSGHKLPTGYEDARLMWLQVQAGDTVVSGAYIADELSENPPPHVYRFQAGHFEAGRATPSDFVARHNVVLEDTRIPPLGMRPDERTQPVGRDYSGGPDNTLRNYDDATFAVPIPAQTGNVSLTVRLMYRSTTKHYVEAISGANRTDDRGRTLTRVFDASGRAAPFSVAEAMTTLTVTAANPGDEGGGCSATPRSTVNFRWIVGFGALGLLALRRTKRGNSSRR
jgi:hypothetical protein